MNPIATSVLVHSVCKSIAECSTRQIMFPRHTFSYRFPTYNLLFFSCPPCQLNFGFMILFIIPFNPILIDSLPSVPVHWVIIIMTGEHFASSGIFSSLWTVVLNLPPTRLYFGEERRVCSEQFNDDDVNIDYSRSSTCTIGWMIFRMWSWPMSFIFLPGGASVGSVNPLFLT